MSSLPSITETIYSKSPPKLRSDLELKVDFSKVKDRPKPNISLEQLEAFKSSRKYIPYAFIRFFNEALTMEQSLESILEFCDRGVLVYSDNSTFAEKDQSIAIAQAFVEKNPGFILCKYPLPIIPQYCNELYAYLEKNNFILPYRFNQIDCLYNYALIELIELAKRNGEYDQALLFKVDMDHVYCPNSLFYAQYYLEQNDDIYDCVHFEKIHIMSDTRRYIFDKFTLEGDNSRLDFGKKDHVWFFELDFMYDHFLGKLDFFEPFGLDFKLFDTISDDGGCVLQNVEMDLVKDINRFPKHTRFLSSFHYFNEKNLYYREIDISNCRYFMNHFYKGQVYNGLTPDRAECKKQEAILSKRNYRNHVALSPSAQALKLELEQQLARFNFIYDVDYDQVLTDYNSYYPSVSHPLDIVKTNDCEFRNWPKSENPELNESCGEQLGKNFGIRDVDYAHYDLDHSVANDFYSPQNCVQIMNNFNYQNLLDLMTPQERKNFDQGKYGQVFPLKRYYRGNLDIDQIFNSKNRHLNDLVFYIEQYQAKINELSNLTNPSPQVSQQLATYQTEIEVLTKLANEFTRTPFVIVQSQVIKNDVLKQKEVEYALAVRGYSEYRKQFILLDYLLDQLVRQENEKSELAD